jgi:cytochrome c oxidase subunit II
MLSTLHTITQHSPVTLASADSWGYWEKLWLRAPAATDAAQHTDSMFMGLWWFCVAWFVVLMVIMGVLCVVYRRRKGQIAQRSASHHLGMELAWTIIPTLMLVVIFFKGFEGYMAKMVPAGGAMELKLTGYKWSWDMEYPNGLVVNRGFAATEFGAEPVPIFYIPSDTPIKLRMNSNDVMHAFWIPDFRIKSDLVPNRYTGLSFTAQGPGDDAFRVKVHPTSQDEADKAKSDIQKGSSEWKLAPGFEPDLAGIKYTEHWVFCAEYCGTSHSEMAAIIRVVSPEDYERWLAWAAKKSTPTDPVEWGKLLYKGKCASCHSVDGSANTGPTWLNMYGYEFEHADGAMHMTDDNHIVESVRNPAKHLRKGYSNNMNAFSEAQLNPKQLDAIISFMKSISDKAPKAAPSTGDKPTEATPADKAKEQASAQ